MGIFYRPNKKENLEIRNKIIIEKGIPELIKNGFEQSPFLGIWYGRDGHNDFSYELLRINKKKHLEIINIDIIRGENWIQIHLNIFDINQDLTSINEIGKIDGVKYQLPPNSVKKMRLRSDDYKGIPLIYMLLYPEHKLGRFYTEKGYKKRIDKLEKLIQKDMTNIDSFSKIWYEMYTPNIVNLKGELIKEK